MPTHQKHRRADAQQEGAHNGTTDTVSPFSGSAAAGYDPEMLYVECHLCGKPILWEVGRTTALLLAAGVDVGKLDERCMILSEGCPACAPGEQDGYTLAVVRIAGLTPEEAAYMSLPGGNA
ncbi:MAG: hypothetical protein LBB66_05540 [Desulfovibrio sp.]|jgi:hypothetical protein|nr:hypothetical protein [Desulfovibrio sp.]